MEEMRIFVITMFLAAGLAGPVSASIFAQEARPIVKTESGAVSGRSAADVEIFKGIPFAAAPTGALRWRPPQPVPAWTETRDAGEFGAPCVQPTFPGVNDELPTGSEDCLTLNVWKPAGAVRGLPVMVWIHGGGHAIGSGSEKYYEGSALARRGVIVVTINYRVGRMGFFAHPALLKEAAARGEPAGNYGMMDQLAALQWVQRNIAAFGGNPKVVTIFGESGGGRSVNWLMTMPLGKGLFARAISQSGRALEPLRGMTETRFGMPPMTDIDTKVVQRLGLGETMDDLRAVPATRFTPPYQQLMAEGFGPFVDGQVLTGDPATLFAEGKQHDVPFMIGVNSWEANMFLGSNPKLDDFLDKFGPQRAEAAKLYGAGTRPDRSVLTDMFQDSVYNATVRVLASRMASVSSPAYAYQFGHVPAFKRADVPGAAHGAEIPYVFDTFYLARNRDKYTDEDKRVAQLIGDYWVAFAKTGDPNGTGRLRWPRYRSGRDAVMMFDQTASVVEGPRRAFVDFQERRVNRLFGLKPIKKHRR
jgi:para-nitrobenzyl esterase